MKYTFPLAFSMNMLSWAVLEFEEEFDYHIDRVKELLKHGVQWLSETNAAHSKVKIKKVSVKSLHWEAFIKRESSFLRSLILNRYEQPYILTAWIDCKCYPLSYLNRRLYNWVECIVSEIRHAYAVII